MGITGKHILVQLHHHPAGTNPQMLEQLFHTEPGSHLFVFSVDANYHRIKKPYPTGPPSSGTENTVLSSSHNHLNQMTRRKPSRFPTPVLPGSGSKGYLKQVFRALSSVSANTPSLPTISKWVLASQTTSRSTATLAYPTTLFMGATSPE